MKVRPRVKRGALRRLAGEARRAAALYMTMQHSAQGYTKQNSEKLSSVSLSQCTPHPRPGVITVLYFLSIFASAEFFTTNY